MAAKWRFGRKQRLISALSTADGLTDNPISMARALRDRFFKMQVSQVPKRFTDDPPAVDARPHTPVTIAEIADVLCPTSNKSAPGPSGHNYKLIKWAFTAQAEHFQTLFNTCLHMGHHPKVWKSTAIAVVPKPGKEDYSLPKCYWPVALLECLGKLLEKVVAKCIAHNITVLNPGLCLTHDVETAHF
jgi:hypothetical protein